MVRLLAEKEELKVIASDGTTILKLNLSGKFCLKGFKKKGNNYHKCEMFLGARKSLVFSFY